MKAILLSRETQRAAVELRRNRDVFFRARPRVLRRQFGVSL
jgi:hypothetical protein